MKSDLSKLHLPADKNDIALLRLNESVPLFSEDPEISAVSPICLPWSRDNFARFAEGGDQVLVTGWGRTSNNKRLSELNAIRHRAGSRILLKLKTPIVSVNECKKADPKFRDLDARTQMCAGAEEG